MNRAEKQVWYSVDDGDRYAIEVPPMWSLYRPREQAQIAEKCADDYHANHDGWEASWPVMLAIYESEYSPAIATFEVDREAVPEFTARLAQGGGG